MNTNTNTAALLRQLAAELPILARQATSDDVALRAACAMRLSELAALLAPYRALHRATPTRRSVLKAGAGVFAAWAIKRDD